MPSGFEPASCFASSSKKPAGKIHVVSLSEFDEFKKSLTQAKSRLLASLGFSAKAGALTILGEEDGAPEALFLLENKERLWDYGVLPARLPRGTYRLVGTLSDRAATLACLGWALGSYRFERYRKNKSTPSQLLWPTNAAEADVLRLAEGVCLARDLVNTPASDLGPQELAQAAKDLAKAHGAKVQLTVGDSLIEKNYPMIHAVGRASSRAPTLIDLRWGSPKDPKLTLVGKGVCFDTGGLDLKPAAFMKLMKKDMGGAALVLGLAHAIMKAKLPVQLRVLIPAVENSVSGNALRPLDVLATRKGITVEVGDTDAEGRLVLGDALTEAVSEKPSLIIDAATLTGAARVALGTAMPAVFSNRTETWEELEKASARTEEPLWRLPLFPPYRSKLESQVADINNIGGDSYGGAIIAGLFLLEFVGSSQDWLHIDSMGYNLESRPGRPAGGEALGLLALDEFLRRRYGEAGGPVQGARKAPRTAKGATTPERAGRRAPAKAKK